MEVVFNAVVTTRLVQKEKRWKDAVVTVGSGVLRVVDEQGKLLLKGAFRGEPEEDQDVRVGGMLIHFCERISSVRKKEVGRGRIVDEVIQLFKESCCDVSLDGTELSLKWGSVCLGKAPEVAIEFGDVNVYRKQFRDGMEFEINSRISEVYKVFLAAVCYADFPAPVCKVHGKTVLRVDRKGGMFYSCQQCSFFRPVSSELVECNIEKVRNVSAVCQFLKKRNIAAHQAQVIKTHERTMLSFLDETDMKKEYARGDLWVLLRNNAPPVFVMADNYGVFSGSRIEIRKVCANWPTLTSNAKVMAVRLFGVQHELNAYAVLLNLSESEAPIFPSLLSTKLVQPMLSVKDASVIMQARDEIITKYHLNSVQKDVLFAVSDIFCADHQVSPVIMVHGVFGAGKSYLLSTIAVYLDKVLTLLGMPDKILIAALSNTAVDNVLSNFDSMGFDDFARVGSLKRIRKNILPYVTGHAGDADINELKSLSNSSKTKEVKQALQNAQNEERTKSCRIDSVRVTGVTCASTSSPVIQQKTFSFVLLDECSQQPEPMSLLPLQFGCKYLICCGDPAQLPPTLSRPAPRGYGRPLFSRVAKFYPPIMLSIQYRCHPIISDICGQLFYSGKIRSGVLDTDRLPVAGMPVITVLDVKYGKESSFNASVYNEAEADIVARIVNMLLHRRDVVAEQIGVISFYRAQAEKISELLSVQENDMSAVPISTVDAFQGDERDVIIITTTRTQKSSFNESRERVNVALSRARRNLIIVTSVTTLASSDIWMTIFRSCTRIPVASRPETGWNPFGWEK